MPLFQKKTTTPLPTRQHRWAFDSGKNPELIYDNFPRKMRRKSGKLF